MSISTQPYKGARDLYPEDKRLQDYIFGVWRTTCRSFGYEEYDAPVLEPIEMFASKTSDEIVNEQTYNFTDRGGRSVVLRPEMTPSVSRMVAARRQELPYPLRLFSIPDCWRYERPQKGRRRQFWQLNVDIFGVETLDAELELLLLAKQIMTNFGASEDSYEIKINSRMLVNQIMSQYLELDSSQSKRMIGLFDRKNKMSQDEFVEQAAGIFNESQRATGLQKVGKLLSFKSLADLPDDLRSSKAVKEVQVLFSLLAEHQVNATFDISLMRGFDYYTDIVFEVFDTNPDNRRSMFGGGRYDGLVGAFGVEPVATVGYAMGDAVIEEFLKSHDLLPKISSQTDLYVIPVGDDILGAAQKVVTRLREKGLNVAIDLSSKKMDKQIKTATKLGIKRVLFVGGSELDSGEFKLKNLESGQQQELTVDKIAEELLP